MSRIGSRAQESDAREMTSGPLKQALKARRCGLNFSMHCWKEKVNYAACIGKYDSLETMSQDTKATPVVRVAVYAYMYQNGVSSH